MPHIPISVRERFVLTGLSVNTGSAVLACANFSLYTSLTGKHRAVMNKPRKIFYQD